MRWSRWRLLALLLVFLPAFADGAAACSCMPSGPPCEAAWTADAVFVGTVRAIEPIDRAADEWPYQPLLVRFDVESGYINAVPGALDLVTARHEPSCGYPFVKGVRYLVYALKSPSGRWTSSICSRTRPIHAARDDLQYLEHLPSPSAGARVFGGIRQWHRDPFENQTVDYGPSEGLLVSVRGAGFYRDTFTDARGRYEIAGLPTGAMTLAVDAPHGFDTRYLERGLELRDPRGCSEQDFKLRYTARASGIVVDAAGTPLSGVAVEAVAAELAGHRPDPYQRPVTTDDRGRFEFDDLPPGQYVFGVNLTRPPARRPAATSTFLPGTPVARDATVITLERGERVDVGVLRLPNR